MSEGENKNPFFENLKEEAGKLPPTTESLNRDRDRKREEDIEHRVESAVKAVMEESGLSRWDAEMIVGGVVKALHDNGVFLTIDKVDNEN